MLLYRLLFILFVLFSFTICLGQESDSVQRYKSVVTDKLGNPLAYSHIINLSSGRGATSNNNGVFEITAKGEDSILFRNVSCVDLVIPASDIHNFDTIRLETKLYSLNEVKIFEWGSTYEDFGAKMMSMPVTKSWNEKLGLPQQSGNPIPNFKNADVLSNPLFAITNPVDFLYYNLNKKQQSIQKVIEFQKNEDQIRKFESVYNRKSISALTGLTNEPLDSFLIFLNVNFNCDFKCSEIQIVSEIFKQWEFFKLSGEN